MIKNGIHIKGIDKVIKDLKSFGEIGELIVAQDTQDAALKIEATAKQIAPKDIGTLRQEIRAYALVSKKGSLWTIEANANGRAPYSAYMEFGTGGLVEVPEEMKDMAIQFKGKGVKKVNITPRPYLYPAFVLGREDYYQQLKQDFEELSKRK